MRFRRLARNEIVALTDRETGDLWTAARRAVRRQSTTTDPVEVAACLINNLPPTAIVAIHRFRTVGTVHNVLLLRGICPDSADLPASPGTRSPAELPPVVEAAALLLIAVSLLLGEPFRSRNNGRLVQHAIPIPGSEHTQTSASSTSALQWHVEDGDTDDRCDHLALLCLRGDPGAVTTAASARHLDLADDVAAILREPRFLVEPDPSYEIRHAGYNVVPVLSGPVSDPEICFDAMYQRPVDPTDRRAAAALTMLPGALDRVAIGHELCPGDLLLLDNKRTVHGRTMFQPRYDGTDRWLLRTLICDSIRARRRGSTDFID